MTSFIRNFIHKQNTLLISNKNGLTHFVRGFSEKLDRPTHRVNNLEKRFLVWTGKYKTVEEVPDHVGQNIVERARNRMRIKIANYMMAATAIGCIIMIISGKRAAQKGESVQQQNLDWHKKIKEDDLKRGIK